MYFSNTLISEKMKFLYTKCCWWDLWSDILKEEFQCVYQEANGVKSRGLPASRTLWEHKCKTNRMKTSLMQSEHMKARRRWSWVRGAEQTLGTPFDPSMRRTCLCRSPTSYDSRFPREPRFSCFTPQSPSASDTGAQIAASPKTAEIPKVFEEGVTPDSSRGFTQIPPRALVELWWIIV